MFLLQYFTLFWGGCRYFRCGYFQNKTMLCSWKYKWGSVFLWFRWPDPSDYNTICLQSAWLQLIFRESSLKMRSSTSCCCLNITPALTCAPPAPRPGHAPLRHGHLNAPSLGRFFLGGGITFASCCCFRTNSFRGGESVCVCVCSRRCVTDFSH